MSTASHTLNGSSPTPSDSEPIQTITSAPKRRRIRRIHRADSNSLYDLLHDNQGTALFVRPIFWTDQHTKILGARFDENAPCDTPVPSSSPGSPPSKGHMRPSPAVTALSDSLSEILTAGRHPYIVSNALKAALYILWPQAFRDFRFQPDMNLHFGGRVYRDAVKPSIMWYYPPETSHNHSFSSDTTQPADTLDVLPSQNSAIDNPDKLPMMCYLGKSQLAMMRKNIFRIMPGPRGSWNGPVCRLQELRTKVLVPLNSDQDPHLVGVFLAMAQRHFYGPPTESLRLRREHAYVAPRGITYPPKFHDVKLRILTTDNDTAEFIIYTATITAEYLQRFQTPWKTPNTMEENLGMKIDYARVPIWPILGLKERLGKAVGQDIVGPFNPDDIETWDADDDPEKVTPLGKRKREETFSEVLNGSTGDDDSSDDEPALTGKKRCLSEGTPVGLVV